ncbi:leucine-rich repeat domain-containing protein [Pseudomonas sp. S2_C03]
MILCLDSQFSEQELVERNELDLRNISAQIWPALLSGCKASDLRLYNLKLPSLEGIDRLINTRRLKLEWATKIETLEPVFKLSDLTHLTVEDFPRLQRLDGIEELSELTELRLSGNLGGGSSPLNLKSIEPISRISKLTKLSLANVKFEVDDITRLARCEHLRHLSLTNQFDRTQIAFLASRLNEQLDEPLTAYVKTHLRCVKCSSPKSMFMGRKMPFLCPACDAQRFEKLVSQFEHMMVDA